MGYPSVLTAKTWGFYDVLFKGNAFKFQRPYGSYVMENVLFKISFPAEFHAQTAVECAMQLHPLVKDRLADIEKITIRTHESAIRIIDKKGPLDNPADRDHCIQYMVAVPLIHGRLTAADYEDSIARDPRIDALRDKMVCVEDKQFSKDYHDPDKRSIANAITVKFKDGTKTKEIVVEYPIGHRRRRKEGIPGADREIPHQPGAPLSGKAARDHPRRRARREHAVRAAGARVRRHDGHLRFRSDLYRSSHAPRMPSSSPFTFPLASVNAAPAVGPGLSEAQARPVGDDDHVVRRVPARRRARSRCAPTTRCRSR